MILQVLACSLDLDKNQIAFANPKAVIHTTRSDLEFGLDFPGVPTKLVQNGKDNLNTSCFLSAQVEAPDIAYLC